MSQRFWEKVRVARIGKVFLSQLNELASQVRHKRRARRRRAKSRRLLGYGIDTAHCRVRPVHET